MFLFNPFIFYGFWFVHAFSRKGGENRNNVVYVDFSAQKKVKTNDR